MGDPRDTSGHRPYLALYPGRVYHLDGLDDDEPDWHHIHTVLGRIHRFGGRSRLTVLHHAFAAYEMASAAGSATRLLAFVHDHHEALVGDMPYPIKRALGGAFGEVEDPAERYVRRWFGLTGADRALVKQIDVALTFAEAIHQGIATWDCPWIVESEFPRDVYTDFERLLTRTSRYPILSLVEEADVILSRVKRGTSP